MFAEFSLKAWLLPTLVFNLKVLSKIPVLRRSLVSKQSENIFIYTIVRSFGIGTHSGTSVEKTCAFAFDGRGNVLAHAFQPEDGRIHLDDDENWTSSTRSGVNLLAIALHEIGHVLGVQHSGVYAAVMHPIAKEGENAAIKLHSDDIAGIRNLYGKKWNLCSIFSWLVIFVVLPT